MSAAYEFHPEARIDLREIVDYISDESPRRRRRRSIGHSANVGVTCPTSTSRP